MPLTTIAIDRIHPNPDQPRKHFDQAEIEVLAESILANGLLQPITVRPWSAAYQIVLGERRWQAHKLLVQRGRKRFAKIRCEVRTLDDRQRDIAAIVENHQRQDITPFEEAAAFQRLVDQGMTVEEIAKAVGSPAFRIRWRLQLLNLRPDIRQLAESGQLDRQAALEVARVPPADQGRLVSAINRGELIGWKAIRTAAETILDPAQGEMFEAPVVSLADHNTLSHMEKRIEAAWRAIGAGWHLGECVIATKVDPNRATRMADQLAAIATSVRVMERELRNTTAQRNLSLEEVA